jgi:hypothetical protein
MNVRRYTVAMIVVGCLLLSPAAADAASKTIRYGPFTVGAGSMDNPTMTTKLRLAVSKPCGDCYITAFKPNLVYSDGSTADMPDVMLHHAVFASQWRSDTTCSGTWLGLAGERFFASGNERSAIDLDEANYGYRQRWYDQWNLLVELMNHSSVDQTVYLEMTFKYRSLFDSAVKPVRPLWLDIDLCGDSEYSIPGAPANTEFTTTRDWTSTISGDVVGMIGHVHAWGVKVSTTNVSKRGQTICTSWAHKDEMQEVMAMDVCTGTPLARIRQGNILRLHSVYELNGIPRDDVMGIMLGYVHRP